MGIARRSLIRGAAALTGLSAGGMLLPGRAYAGPAIHNPFAGYPITNGWQDHLNRGSRGGIDFGMRVGTPLPACGAGTVTNTPFNGGGGHTVTISHSEGYRSQYLHLSQFALANGTYVSAGAIVGLSGGAAGAPGSGSSTGPHLHWHMINPAGAYLNPLVYIAQNPPAGAGGPMFHQIRVASGAWTGFQPLDGYQTTAHGSAKDMAVAGLPDGTAQMLIVGLDDGVYHRIRNANGTWSPFQPLNGVGTTGTARGKRVAIAGLPDGSAQVVIVGVDDTVYHRIRYADGNWTAFGRLNGFGTPSPAGARDVAISGQPDGTAQVVIVGMDSGIYHRIRSVGGPWSEFQPLDGNGTGTTAIGSAVAVAGLPDGSSQVVIAGVNGYLHHRIRSATGAWSPFQPLNGSGTSSPAVAKDVAVAGLPDGTSQVVIVGADDAIYHRVRGAGGSWTEFNSLPGVGTPTPARGSRVSLAGLPDNSTQLALVGR
ncbi:peptidoglycan DD-metalloendopeptidase family protein [Micromonospora rubida]|uniref:peptidoglycan DD-metalloendopeptidase family protein n=1 Tax=Micromonospora rubida TaxID=2697657 RepID=UPI0013766522|nr:peptidoglycan DD-metalloendopeptidase family protein [Micromonospora rubida]NBE79996.1 peptidoglycan DD-metalloendopeptidase family protein [Micromonospora rubida]